MRGWVTIKEFVKAWPRDASIEDLDAILAQRCRLLNQDRELVAAHTGFHWWPKRATPN
jgi:hypothetical protein